MFGVEESMKRVRRCILRRLATCAGVMVLVCGCSGLFDPKSNDLEDNLAKWSESGIEDYRFRSVRLCFCIGDEPVIIEVEADTIASVTDANTGDLVDP